MRSGGEGNYKYPDSAFEWRRQEVAPEEPVLDEKRKKELILTLFLATILEKTKKQRKSRERNMLVQAFTIYLRRTRK